MSKSSLVTLLLSAMLWAGCGSQKAALMEMPLAAGAISAAPAEPLTAAGGGNVGWGHLGTALALFFPMDRAIDNSWMADINFNFNVHRNISVEANAAWTKADVVSGTATGELQMMPVTIQAQYGDVFGTAGRWYGGIGLGWILNDFDGGGVTAKDAFGVNLNLGVDVPVNDFLSLCVELRYQLANTDLSTGETLDLDAFMFRVNMVWLF